MNPKINISLLALHILEFCEKENYSYDGFSVHCKVSRSTISNIKNHNNKGESISVITMFKITSKLGTNIYDYIQN